MNIFVRSVAAAAVSWTLAAPALAQQAVEATAQEMMRAGRHADALAALAGAREGADPETAARIDLLRSRALRALGRLPDAEDAATRGRRTAESARLPGLTARALLQLSELATDRGDNAAAAAFLASALTAARASGDSRLQVNILEALGRNARARGDNPAALSYLGDAIAAAEGTGDLDLLTRALGARSTTLLGLGRFDEALADAQTAYDHVAGTSQSRLEGVAAFALAQAQAHVGNLDRAVMLWGEALVHYEAAGLQIGVALATKQRMETWFALGEFDRAAADGAAALGLFERTGSAGTTPELFARLALIEARRGNNASAQMYAARADALMPSGPRRRFVENDLGLTALFLGDHDAAVARFTRVLDQALALGDEEYAWRGESNRGRARLALGRRDDAARDLRAAVERLERMRRTLPDTGLRASFMSDRRHAHAMLVDALLGDPGEADEARLLAALAVAEQSRARSLIEQLAEANLRETDPGLEQIRAEEAAFAARLNRLQQRIAALPPGARPRALDELTAAEAEYEALVIRLRREHGAYASLVNPAPLDPRAILGTPRQGEAIISYLFTPDGGAAWVVAGGRVRGFRIPARARIEAQVRLMHALILGRDIEGMRAVGADLYNTLLRPAGDLIEDAERLTIVPDGPLHRLPFALLRRSRDAGGWLAESRALAFAPSATVLAWLRERGADAPDALAAFAAASAGSTRASGGDAAARGDLRHAGLEVSEIARVVEGAGRVSVEPYAAESGLKRLGVDRFRILHFAAHAAVDETSPRRSAILLGASTSDDGLLQLNEIAALDLNAALVVLAACRSHVGRSVEGEGLMSLSRAFMRAGAGAVIAALWDVDDAETRRFMRFFYGGLMEGRAPDRALVGAQRSMLRRGGDSAAPHNWAAFVITGAASEPVFAAPARRTYTAFWLLPGILAAMFALRLAWRRRETATAR